MQELLQYFILCSWQALQITRPLCSPFFFFSPFWRGVCKFSPYFGNVYPFAKSQYCLIWLIVERSEDPRPEVKGILQSKTPVKHIQFLQISTSDSSWCSYFFLILPRFPESYKQLNNLGSVLLKGIYYFIYIYAASCFLKKKITVSIQIGLLILCFTNSLSPHR